MLHIVLTILKILGIIILALLGLVLVLVLCILFVPIRYSARVEYHGTLTVNARVSFLFRLLNFRFQRNTNTVMTFRIFGINTHWFDDDRDKRSLKSRKKKMEEMEKETEMFEQLSEEIHQESHIFHSEAEDNHDLFQKPNERSNASVRQKDDAKQEIPAPDSVENGFHEEESDKTKERDSVFIRFKKFISEKLYKIKYIFRRFCDTIKNIYGKIRWLKEFLQDERTWQAFRDLKAEIIKLFKHVKPRKIKGYLHFGFDNPCITGKLYGFICMFYGTLPKAFLVKADFEHKVLDGDLLIKGRIHIYYLLILALRLYRNDNLRQIMEKRRTYGRE